MQRVWRYVVLGAILSLPMACKKAPTPAEIAAHAAKGYYDQLLKGDYKAFVDGTYHPERIPDSYREQLETAAKMYMAQQQDEHRGIKSVKVQGCVLCVSLSSSSLPSRQSVEMGRLSTWSAREKTALDTS